jgi:hypothetical protein
MIETRELSVLATQVEAPSAPAVPAPTEQPPKRVSPWEPLAWVAGAALAFAAAASIPFDTGFDARWVSWIFTGAVVLTLTRAVFLGGAWVRQRATAAAWTVPLWEPFAWAAFGFAVIFAALVLGSGERWLHWPATGLALVGLAAEVRATLTGVQVARQRYGWLAFLGVAQTALGLCFTVIGGLTVLLDAAGGFRRGRQLRSKGRLQLPPLGRGTEWTTLPQAACATGDADQARALAAQWRENGRTEHASVAAFARLSLDLIGLGAPSSLLAQAQADGLDEIRHAEACFSLARDLDGEEIGPVSFPAAARAAPRSRVRSLALVQLAIDSLVEGALHEGLSARVVAQLAKRCEHPRIQPMLATIASDEGRHAAHAWDVLAWCVDAGGLPVRAALQGALAALPRTMESSLPTAARDGSWVGYGIHGDALEQEGYARSLSSVTRRAEALLAGTTLAA